MGMYGLTYSLYHPEGNSDFILLFKSNSLLLECLLVVWNKLFCLTTAATGPSHIHPMDRIVLLVGCLVVVCHKHIYLNRSRNVKTSLMKTRWGHAKSFFRKRNSKFSDIATKNLSIYGMFASLQYSTQRQTLHTDVGRFK